MGKVADPPGHDDVPTVQAKPSAGRGRRRNGTNGIAPASDSRSGLYWESVGRGEPLLLIMGLGLSGGAWWRTVPVLSSRFRVITYDHRGVGRSQSETHTYTTEAMADDAAAVLDAAGVDAAHVYGFSLGGLVAQQLAVATARADVPVLASCACRLEVFAGAAGDRAHAHVCGCGADCTCDH